MDIDKELEDLFDDPLLDISEKEKSLFDIPEDMQKAQAGRTQPDHYAQRKVCEDFAVFQSGFLKVHQELKEGKRSLVKTSKTDSMQQGAYYVVDGQLLYLASIGEQMTASNGTKDGRTRCIFENGTETDILLQTLRRNVMESGYAITATQEEEENVFKNPDGVEDGDKVTGYIYILSSLSNNPEIRKYDNLYKIGFTINSVEERVANAANEPTYLMAPVKVEASYKIVNMNSHVFETLVHQVLDAVQLQLTVTDNDGNVHHPQEWYVVPLPVVNTIIEKIVNGSITKYTYNPALQCLEKRIVKAESTFNTTGMKVLSLIIKKCYFDDIMSGEKKIEYRELKQTTLKKYTFIDESDGKRYLKRYDALRLFVGYNKDRESALVQVVDTTYDDEHSVVEYHLGSILEHVKP